MNPLSSNPQIKKAVTIPGASVVNTGAKTTGVKTPAKANAPVTPTATTVSENGVQKTTKPDGSIAMQSESGVEVGIKDGVKTVKLPEGGASFELKDGEVKSLGGEVEGLSTFKNDDGVDLISFADKKGDLVQVDPDSLIYEVVRKEGEGFTSQVMYPDGLQELVVDGRERQESGKITDYTKRALFNQDGELVKSMGFEGLDVKDGKASFKLSNGATTSRSLPRAVPGQEAPPEAKTPETPIQNSSAPEVLLAEEPPLLQTSSEPASAEKVQTEVKEAATPEVSTPEGPTQKEIDAAIKAERKARIDELAKVGPNFFDASQISETVDVQQAPNGVVKRIDVGESIAFSLPNGDQFRTDGDVVAILGDNPRARSPKLVQEDDGRTLLAYSDKKRNSYQLDITTGDFQVTNADGSLSQKFNSDGSQEISARSVHTTEAGSKRHSEHSAKFGADGQLIEKSGFDNLEVDAKSLVYTLPDGKPTVRNLMDSTDVRYKEEKPAAPAPGSWGDTESIVDGILGTGAAAASTSAAAANPTSETPTEPKVNATSSASTAKEVGPSKTVPSGVSRVTLEDGTVVTKLPNGIHFHDGGEQKFAVDKDGNRLEVHTREGIPSESGYIMYAKGKDGVGYTITPDSLDMIAESRDGKVHQQLWENGAIETKIKDGPAQHAHVADPQMQIERGTPWIYADPSQPNLLKVKDQAGTSYELPLTLPLGPQHSGPGPMTTRPMGQGADGAIPQQGSIPQQGTKPSLWERTKAFFRGESPQQYGNNGYPPQMAHGRGMPCSHHQYDPVQDQMREMNRMTRMTNTMTMVGMGVNLLSSLAFMPCMFFGGGMGYGMGYF